MTLERGLHPVVMTIAKLEPVRTTDLAAALALKTSTISRHLARLEQLGLVQRSGDPSDARASLLTLSDEGHRTHSVLTGAWQEILAEQLALAEAGRRRAGPPARQRHPGIRAVAAPERRRRAGLGVSA